jgi:predicted ATPase
VAMPDILTACRTFLADHPVQPPSLTSCRLRSLSPTAIADCHTRRIAWLAADVVLEAPPITALERQMRILLARNNSYSATARRGLALSGAAGLGKSTATLLIGKRTGRSES